MKSTGLQSKIKDGTKSEAYTQESLTKIKKYIFFIKILYCIIVKIMGKNNKLKNMYTLQIGYLLGWINLNYFQIF